MSNRTIQLLVVVTSALSLLTSSGCFKEYPGDPPVTAPKAGEGSRAKAPTAPASDATETNASPAQTRSDGR
ncbi:MAG: hypothetical protein H7Y38_01720 [Armatimonadetes bacterium]|nr:hypothetical protein [Armatimonadota bacterium]